MVSSTDLRLGEDNKVPSPKQRLRGSTGKEPAIPNNIVVTNIICWEIDFFNLPTALTIALADRNSLCCFRICVHTLPTKLFSNKKTEPVEYPFAPRH